MIRTKTIVVVVIAIAIITAISIVGAPIPKSAFASANEDITGKGVGTLTCSNGAVSTNTQIVFNAIVPFHTAGPAIGTMTLTFVPTITALQTPGKVTSGFWNPNTRSYSASGTTTSDEICGITGSPFTISGIIGPSVPISMDAKYSFKGTGNVAATNATA